MSLKTIDVAVELVAEMGEWSKPVRVRYTEEPTPMLELQTVDLAAAIQDEGIGEVRRAEEGYKLSTLQGVSVSEPGTYYVVRIDGEETE